MKALMIFLLPDPAPARNVEQTSGGDEHLVELSKRLLKAGRGIHILTTEGGADFLKVKGVNVEIQMLKILFDEVLYKSILGVAVSYSIRVYKALLCSFYLPRSIDIICATSHFFPDVVTAAIMSKLCSKSKLIVYLHHLIPPPMERVRYHPLLPSFLTWISQKLSLMIIKHYDFNIFTYPHVKEQLTTMGFREEKIKCISNGLHLKYIQEIPPAKEGYDACFVGRISPLKGSLDLVSIWRYVCDKLPEARLVVIGHGMKSYLEKLKDDVKNKKLKDNVILLGFRSEQEKFSILKSSKVFISPSYEEGWGIAICEAMACGLPVVAYNLPAYRPIYKHGIKVVPIGDRNVFAEEVVKLLRNPELRGRLGKEAMDQASEYSWDLVVLRELQILKQIVEK